MAFETHSQYAILDIACWLLVTASHAAITPKRLWLVASPPATSFLSATALCTVRWVVAHRRPFIDLGVSSNSLRSLLDTPRSVGALAFLQNWAPIVAQICKNARATQPSSLRVGARSPTTPDTPHPAIFRAPSRFGASCVWQNLRAVGSARRSWRALLSVLAGDPSQARERLPEPPHSMWLFAPFWSRLAPNAPPPSGYPSLLRCAYYPRYRSGACWRIVWALARNSRGAFAHDSRHRLKPAGVAIASYCRLVCLSPIAKTQDGYRRAAIWLSAPDKQDRRRFR